MSNGYYEELRGSLDASGRCPPKIHHRFIAMWFPFDASSTHLDNLSFQASPHKGQRNHIALRLLAQGSAMVLVMALGWWGTARPDLRRWLSRA